MLISQRRVGNFLKKPHLNGFLCGCKQKLHSHTCLRRTLNMCVYMCVCMCECLQRQQKNMAAATKIPVECLLLWGCCSSATASSLQLVCCYFPFLPKSCNLPLLLLLMQLQLLALFLFYFLLSFLVSATHAPLCNWFSCFFFAALFSSRASSWVFRITRPLKANWGHSPAGWLID